MVHPPLYTRTTDKERGIKRCITSAETAERKSFILQIATIFRMLQLRMSVLLKRFLMLINKDIDSAGAAARLLRSIELNVPLLKIIAKARQFTHS